MNRWLLGIAVLLVGCDDDGPLMTPGQDCQQSGCHNPEKGRRGFTLSGTVFPEPGSIAQAGTAGVVVLVTDANGKQLGLTSNEVGNFYTDASLKFPVFVAVQAGASVRHMEPSLVDGSCNRCHDNPPTGSAGGRVFISPP